MRVLVTGAEGFVGRTMVRTLLASGHEVQAGIRPGGPAAVPGLPAADRGRVAVAPLELLDSGSIDAALAWRPDAVVHLAAMASGADARRDIGAAWEVNAAGTARLAEALGRLRASGAADPLLLVVSTGEVYGAGVDRPRREDDPLVPCSPYAASKLGAEVAALETWRRTGLRVVIARPFPHTGGGQGARFVAPAFAARLREAKRTGAASVATGNLEPVRDFLHVQDVADAYLALIAAGVPGEAYNIARGEGIALRELFDRLAAHLAVAARPVPDPALMRSADILHLVGDPAKLRDATGWRPTIGLDRTLKEVADAEAD
ncbi:MAG TPA: GDP-mannose 4,6-dehydratase [Gemmatimonadales bacterium]|nr:GDP-mannose 4,6-dehydratase [Gemmatimonadales bacterium]